MGLGFGVFTPVDEPCIVKIYQCAEHLQGLLNTVVERPIAC